MDRVLDEEDELSELIEGRIVNIFYLFSQAENYVKEVVADRVVLKRTYDFARQLILLTSFRRSQRSAKDDSNTSSDNAEVHQESFYAINNAGQFACSKCNRALD